MVPGQQGQVHLSDRGGSPAAPCRAAVLGSPIAHSLSPVLHTAAYDALGLAAWTYGSADVDEIQFVAHVAGWTAAGGGCR